MNCDDAKALLQDYATRQLTAEERHAIDRHLLDCEECRRELALISAVVSSLDSQPSLHPSPGFNHKVMASLPDQIRPTPSPWWSLLLVPVLGGLAYLFRSALSRGLLGLLDRTGIDWSALSQTRLPDLPAVSPQNLALALLAAAGIGVAVVIGAATLCWRYYSEGP